MEAHALALNDEIHEFIEGMIVDGREIGMQVVAYHCGRQVVSIQAGTLTIGGSPVQEDTIFPTFSVIKGVIAVAAHVQAERGLLDIDAPIATYWPEFSTHGKQAITLRHVFSHTAGVPQMPTDMTVERFGDWTWMTEAIANLEPMHEPGTQSYYHGMTYGWLIGEAVRRTDPAQRPFDQFVTEEICEPLNIKSLYLAVPETVRSRVATLYGEGYPADLPAGSALRVGLPAVVDLRPEVFNRPDIQRAVAPAVGGYANADGVARVFAMLAGGGELDGCRLLSQERVAALSIARPNSDAPDPFLGGPARLSEGGFMLGGAKPAVGSRIDTMFSIGAGGSIAWADSGNNLAVAITHNQMYKHQSAETDPQVAIGRMIRRGLRLGE